MEIYLVGGAVRDELLGLPVEDHDWVVTGATPEDMLEKGFKQVGADFPVFLHPETGEEYALARTERKNGRGYHGFTVYAAPDVSLVDDLKRRDLTINAMARSGSGELIDPYHGRQDLESGTLRHVSEAFAEDPLRILRTARFAARYASRGFSVAESTAQLMADMVQKGEVDHLVPERVWQELSRALSEPSPQVFFTVLNDCRALAKLAPALDDPHCLDKAQNRLQCAAKTGLTRAQRFAALMSPLSVDQVDQTSKQLKAPNEFADLARLTAKTAAKIQHGSLSSNGYLHILNDCDAWRRPERFDQILKTLHCVLAERFWNAINDLQNSLRACEDIQPKALVEQGFTGKALGEAIQQERLRRIEDILGQQA